MFPIIFTFIGGIWLKAKAANRRGRFILLAAVFFVYGFLTDIAYNILIGGIPNLKFYWLIEGLGIGIGLELGEMWMQRSLHKERLLAGSSRSPSKGASH